MKRSKLGIAVAIGAALAVGIVTGPAHADTWAYPGGANCTQQTAFTASNTANGSGTQHRAEGYSGYYYASWGSTWYTQYRQKNWGWNTILSSRVGTTGSGGSISTAAVGCAA